MERNTNQTRSRLLEAARNLFWEKGYAATGMAEILERGQANSGSFYHFFASKEALLLAVLDGYVEALEPMVLRPAFARHRDPIVRIFAILQGYRERILGTGCRYGCPLGRLALEIEAENLPAHQRIADNFSGWTSAVRKCLQQAREQGRLAPDLDLDALATFVLTAMEGGVMQSRSYRSVEPFDQSVAQLRSYFTYLITKPARGKVHRRGTSSTKKKGNLK